MRGATPSPSTIRTEATALTNRSWVVFTPNSSVEARRRETRMNVGIVGLGRMGLPIAASLIEAGFTVIGYRRGSMEHFVSIGGRPASSSQEVAERCDVVLTCVHEDGILRQSSACRTQSRGCRSHGTLHRGRSLPRTRGTSHQSEHRQFHGLYEPGPAHDGGTLSSGTRADQHLARSD